MKNVKYIFYSVSKVFEVVRKTQKTILIMYFLLGRKNKATKIQKISYNNPAIELFIQDEIGPE